MFDNHVSHINPSLTYSACIPYASLLVYKSNCLKLCVASTSFFISSGLAPKLELTLNLTLQSGFSFHQSISLQKSCDIVASPPVTLSSSNVSFNSISHHLKKASMYGLSLFFLPYFIAQDPSCWNALAPSDTKF